MQERKDLPGQVTGLVALLAVACFFILGFTTGEWGFVWVIFLAIPLTAIIMDIIVKKKDIQGMVTGLVAILAAAVFLILGFSLHLWHIAWLVFLAIPLTAVILDAVLKRKDMPGAIIGLVSILATVSFLLMGFLMGIWHIAWIVFLLIPITSIIINMVRPASKGPDSGPKDL
jgi:hypothetical protein